MPPAKKNAMNGAAARQGTTLRLRGCAHFRQRLVCATLSGRPVVIEDIRAEDEAPGLTDFEANFLRLLDRLTNGSHIEVNETGTKLKYSPGFVVGGRIEHDCGTARAIGWFLEPLAALAPFGKLPLHAELRGITNDNVDTSVDAFKAMTLPLLKHFGLDEGLDFKIKKRGAPPLGGGEVRPSVRATDCAFQAEANVWCL